MKLKGLVWFFAIALTLISIWELSYTWVVRSYENKVKTQAERIVKSQFPDAKGEEKDLLVKGRMQHILDSTRDKKIYPIVGSSYQKCKENELNLGLDLQGGMSVTLEVSLEGLLKSLSNNPKDPALLKAIQTANAEKVNSDVDYISLFTKVYKQQNPASNLASLFAGAGKQIKITDNDDKVADQIRTTAKGAINQTYKILLKRIDKFGVAQPNINLDENKGIINVELAGVTDKERVRKYLQSSANLQFWEVYNIGELSSSLENVDKAVTDYLSGVSVDTAVKSVVDSAKINANKNAFLKIINPISPQQDKTGKQIFASAIGNIALKDTGTFNSYMALDVVKNNLPGDCKFLLGVEEKVEKTGQRFYPLYAIKTVMGSDKAQLEGDGVEEAGQGFDDRGRPSIKMQMTNLGSKTWARLTTNNVNRPIAIALDDIVYSAPNVNGPIEGGSSEISGNFTIEEAQDLANILKAGKLDAPAKIVAEQVVGPTLGKEAVNGGAKSFLIAFAVIFALMLIYYNTGGWVANIALILNVLFTVGVLTAMGFTLTSAGIAGLVLTIGMAVDTNVIIFERIKEELTKGKSYPQAVNDGYKRSLAPVIDAHVTSFLTAAILFIFGLGPVLGFATTQMLGITLSLFCGILVSRLITDFWTNKQRHFNYFTGISKKVFTHTSINFIKYRKIAYGISIVVLLLGIGSYFNGFHEGVEFKGGRSYTVQFAQPVKNDDVRDDLKNAFGGDFPVIKTVGDNKHLNITTSYLKGQDNADAAVQTKLYEGLKKVLPGVSYEDFIKTNIQSSQTVQPTISEDLKRGAIKATIFSIVIIFIYILLRFRDWRYSFGTIVALLHDVLVTLAVFSFLKNVVPFPLEIDQHFIAAVLTVIGFSMNDTVIVFDRIREYSKGSKASEKGNIINRAVNDTLSRTIMTSLTVFLTLLILFIFGGEVTRGFAFAMLIGVVTGTYSSIFVAAPILVDFAKDKPLGEAEILSSDKGPATV
ncbi:protein translocase subunit SecDF [Ferruginibacter lapsinanis]|uniref:protein translocase subunit SecDF n=1 Tax=Ferruginibacter lapsinanis TaxID=563172 RepID=UPI001E387BB7|nr:protein translocase subunit SecDF [Ferruginibacter lapsinanis]UEG48799.1 protein translocase subunit SecDF [Ferruginibacter lapsinanis]